jgi:hypothetical protein
VDLWFRNIRSIMFGYAAFAQPTFAGLGGNSFVLSLSEDIIMADASSQIFAFNPSVTENVVMDDIDATTGDFFGLINEFVAIQDD